MCTAITFQAGDFYFGRTLDHDQAYGEEVTITPRRYPFHFRHCEKISNHFAIIGMAHVENNVPLYYDATNEFGLCMAGLHFVGNAFYSTTRAAKKDNIASFELIPWILSQCRTVKDALRFIKRLQIRNTPFSPSLPPAELHWLIADKTQAIVLEPTKNGLKVYHNPVGVLTNNPPFPVQMTLLNNYMSVSPHPPKNEFCATLPLHAYSRGMGGIGLPGDLSSSSRFVRAAFTRCNAISGKTEGENVNSVFHVLNSVTQTKGCCISENGTYEITLYTACCNATRGIYYYTTYNHLQVNAIDMHAETLNERTLYRFPLHTKPCIRYQNGRRTNELRK